MKKRGIALLVFVGILLALVKIPYQFTQGFRLNKILYPQNYVVSPDNFKVQANWNNVKGMLDQPFTYIGKGNQVYVFESADGKSVLKLVRYHKYQKPLWTYASSLFHINEKRAQIFRKEQKERFLRAIESYRIAQEDIPEISGVLFAHLYPTKDMLKQTVSIKDNLGRNYKINLDEVGFLVQKKAVPLDRLLIKLYKENKLTEVQSQIASFFQMISHRASKGVFDRDYRNAIRNSGVCDEGLIELDLGSFYIDPDHSIEELYLREMDRSKEILLLFVKKKMPRCLDYVTEEIQKNFQEDLLPLDPTAQIEPTIE